MKKEKYVVVDAAQSTNKPEWVLQSKEIIEVRVYFDNANQAKKIYCSHDDLSDEAIKKIAKVI